MNARTGSVPWDLSGRAKTPEEYKVWLEERECQRQQRKMNMSYYDLPPGNADCELGRKIYMEALSDRRGFRDDQLGIEDAEIWAEIFEEIGKVARSAVAAERT